MYWPTEVRGVETSILGPIGNLSIGVSEIRTCMNLGPDMSGKGLWNPVLASDMSDAGT
jgi:hypothetical protein